MRYFLHVLPIVFFISLGAQVPAWDWAINPVQHRGYQMGKSLISVDGLGYTYILSESRGIGANPSLLSDSGVFLARVNRTGQVMWAKKIPGTPASICADQTGNVYVGGKMYSYTTPTVAVGAFISKYDLQGSLIWEYTSSNIYTSVTALTVSPSGKLFVTGSKADVMVISTKTLTGGHTFMAACFLPDGSLQWARSGEVVPDTSHLFGFGEQLCVDANDNLYVTYRYGTCPNWSCLNAGLLKLDQHGNYILHKDYSGYDGVCNGIAVDAAGDIYMSHCKSAWTSGGSHVLRRYKPDMSSWYWEKEVAAWECQDQFIDSRPLLDKQGSVYIAGAIGSQCGTYVDTLVYGTQTVITDSVQDIALVKMDCLTGNYQKVWHIPGDLYDLVEQIDMDRLGNIYAVGLFNIHTYFNGNGSEANDTLCFGAHCLSGGTEGSQLFVAKLKLSSLDFNNDVGLTTQSISKIRVAPNPSSGPVNFGVVPVNLVEVFNSTGQCAGRFVPGPENQINLEKFPDGIYFLRMVCGNAVSTGRLVLAR